MKLLVINKMLEARHFDRIREAALAESLEGGHLAAGGRAG